jgi:translation initiation factor eIF-2B subunit alpha
MDDPLLQEQHPVIADLVFHLSKSSSSSVHDTTSSLTSSSDDTTAMMMTYEQHQARLSSCIPLPVAAIRVLLDVIRRSQAETMMGLQAALREASELMLDFARRGGPIVVTTEDNNNENNNKGSSANIRYILAGRYHIALSSGCEIFMKHVTRMSQLETPDFNTCRQLVLDRGTAFASYSIRARDTISAVGCTFVREGCAVLTHGRSRVVESILLRAALVERKRFQVYVLEGRPDAGGAKSALSYINAGIPTTVVLDSAMGYIMERVDMVLVGADCVMENGGTVNKIGTFALGVVAKEMGVPLYVAAESYKFTRLYPLNNADLPEMNTASTSSTTGNGGGGGGSSLKFIDTLNATMEGKTKEDGKEGIGKVVALPSSVSIENPPCDFTPAKYITLLFTDLGVLTPSAVSDELIRLYQ